MNEKSQDEWVAIWKQKDRLFNSIAKLLNWKDALINALQYQLAEWDELIEVATYIIEHATFEDVPSGSLERWYALREKWQAYQNDKRAGPEPNDDLTA